MIFVFPNKKTWDEIYILAKKYYEYHGNLNMPVNFRTTDGIKYDEDGVNLNGWVNGQRHRFKIGKLPKGKIEKLKEIGMIFNSLDIKSWNDMYILAKSYYDYYGNLNIPVGFKTTDGINYDEKGSDLYNWIDNQIQFFNMGILSAGKIKRLKNISAKFIISDRKFWNLMYTLAKNYYDHYGNLNIPVGFKTTDGINYDENGIKLGNWILNQKTNYTSGKLSIEQINALELIGIVWNIRINRYNILKACDKYGIDCEINRPFLEHTSIQELLSKIAFLEANNIELVGENGRLHEIFSMSNINIEVNYGISLQAIIKEYYIESQKEKVLK